MSLTDLLGSGGSSAAMTPQTQDQAQAGWTNSPAPAMTPQQEWDQPNPPAPAQAPGQTPQQAPTQQQNSAFLAGLNQTNNANMQKLATPAATPQPANLSALLSNNNNQAAPQTGTAGGQSQLLSYLQGLFK